MCPVRESVRRLKAYTPGEQPSAADVVKLNTNENPYPPSPRVAEALRGLDPRRLQRYPDPLCGRLRERLAEIHACRASQVFAGNGADEVLALCTRAFVEPGRAVGFLDPSYSLYPVLADIQGARRAPTALGPAFEWREPRTEGCDLFLLTNPNAPSGVLYPRADVQAFCRRFAGVVALDEAYVDFADADGMELARESDHVLAVRSLSKSFSLAGLRVGYAVGPEPLIEALLKIKDSYHLDALAQELALAALSDLPHMRRNVARIRATRERTVAGLRARGFEVWPSQANFVWTRPGRRGARDLFERLRDRKILVRHFADDARTRDFLRISIGTDEEIDRLMAALDAL